jgi:hypothetical protein
MYSDEKNGDRETHKIGTTINNQAISFTHQFALNDKIG